MLANVRLHGSPHPCRLVRTRGLGARGVQRPPGEKAVCGQRDRRNLHSSHHTAFGGQEPREQARSSVRKQRREQLPNFNESICSLPSKLWEVWVSNFHQTEQTHTHQQ